jgi:hypothetical protein
LNRLFVFTYRLIDDVDDNDNERTSVRKRKSSKAMRNDVVAAAIIASVDESEDEPVMQEANDVPLLPPKD